MAKRLWDFTALDVAERCEEEFCRRFLHNLESPRLDLSATFGQALHVGTKVLYDGDASGTAIGSAVAYYEKAAAPIREAEFFVNKKPYLTGEYVGAIVEMYAKVYEGKLSCVLNEQYLASEKLGLDGILDRVVERGGALVVRDLKSTGLYIGDAWGNQWQQSAQAAGYLDLAEETLGQDVSNFWCDAIHVDKRGYPKEGDFHEFGPFSYSPALRAELREQRGRAIARANELAEHPERAVKRTHNCMRYNSLCGFFSYCHADPEERDARYEMARASGALATRTWSPEKRDEA